MTATPATDRSAHEATPDSVALDAVLPLIAAVDSERADMLRTHPATATYERLPFYAAGGLLRAVARVPRPVMFRYVYIPETQRLYRTGTPDLLRTANQVAGFRLRQDVALTYLRYYLEVAGNRGFARRRLAATAADVPWLPATETESAAREERARLAERIHPATVISGPDGGFRVTSATVQYQAIEIVTFEITAAGEVTIGHTTSLTDDAPVVQVL